VSAAGKAAADSPTAPALARLNAIVPTPDTGGSTEVRFWLEAAVAGSFELPAAPLRIVEQAAHLAEQIAANVKPKPYRAGFVDDVLDGATLDEILERDAEHAAALARWEAREALLSECRRVFAGRAGAAFTDTADDLIRNELRAAVDALLADAKAAAAKLKEYAPDFGPKLLESGNAADLATWRSSRELQAKFNTLVAAWTTSWTAATGRGLEFGREYCPARAGGWYCWENPGSIADEAVRLGHDGELLKVAIAPSPFRLLAMSELEALIADVQAALPADSRMSAPQMVRAGVCTPGA
jgi:hypothetical protein